MKTPLLYLLACLLLLASACREDKTEVGGSLGASPQYFVLPKTDNSIAVSYLQNGMLREAASFPISGRPLYAFDDKQLAILNTEAQELSLFNIETGTEFETNLPFDLQATALLLKDDQLFIGGRLSEDKLLQYQIGTDEWFTLEVPEEVRIPGKEIDDFVIHEGYLIAVDNVIVPKYLLYYQLNTDAPSAYLERYHLISNGSGESIKKARATDEHLGLLSNTSSGYIGLQSHIAVYKWEDRNQVFTLSTHALEEEEAFQDFLFFDRQIIFAGTIKGIGRMQVQDSFFVDRNNSTNSHHLTPPAGAITFEPLPNIVKLTAAPNSDRFIVTTRASNGEYTHLVKAF